MEEAFSAAIWDVRKASTCAVVSAASWFAESGFSCLDVRQMIWFVVRVVIWLVAKLANTLLPKPTRSLVARVEIDRLLIRLQRRKFKNEGEQVKRSHSEQQLCFDAHKMRPCRSHCALSRLNFGGGVAAVNSRKAHPSVAFLSRL